MNTTILRRLAWKEFRILRGFWVAVMVLCCVCLMIMAWRMSTTDEPANLFFVAMGITACYALGCGAIAFAGEREARTDDFQRVLPVTARELLLGKLVHALTSTLMLGLIAGVVAWLRRRWLWKEYELGTSPAHGRSSAGAAGRSDGHPTAGVGHLLFVVLLLASACGDAGVSRERCGFVSDHVAVQ